MCLAPFAQTGHVTCFGVLAFIIKSPVGRKVIVQDNYLSVDSIFNYKHN